MDSFSHDLYLLMIHLSQLRDSDLIIDQCVDGMNGIGGAAQFRFVAEDTQALPGEVLISVCTSRNHFGYLGVQNASEDSEPLVIHLHNATQMLGLILENRQQWVLLERQNEVLEETVKERTQNLEASEAQFRRIVETGQEGIWTIDAEGKTTFVNAKMADMLGYEVQEMQGAHLFTFLDEEGKRIAEHHMERRRSGIKETHEFKLQHKQGHEVWTIMGTNPLYDAEGNYIGALAMVSDVTEKRRIQQQVDHYQHQLKRLVQKLTLTEEKERKRLAMELHDGIGQALALSKLRVDQMLANALSPTMTTELEELSQSLLGLIGDTRSLTADLGSPMLHELGLTTAIEQWLENEVCNKHGLQAVVHDDRKGKPLDRDTISLLFRAVRELSINVVKHAQATRIEISLETIDAQLFITVADDGIGFSPAALQGQDEHTGYGLFSIQERIAYLGGHVRMRSAPEGGAQVELSIPLTCEHVCDEVLPEGFTYHQG